jgi:hypothetical protein
MVSASDGMNVNLSTRQERLAEGLSLASPHPSPASRMLVEDMCGWAPRWTEIHSRSYGLKEAQARARVDQQGLG